MEHKKKITTHLQEFYNEMPIMLNEFGRSDLVELLGKLRSGDKKCIALQAADVLCWYKRRAEDGALDEREQKRYSKVARKNGVHHEWSKQEVETIYAGCIRILNEQGRSSIG